MLIFDFVKVVVLIECDRENEKIIELFLFGIIYL